MANNWWDAPQFGGAYKDWWGNLKTEGLNSNPDFTGGAYDPAESSQKFWEGLVNPSGNGGKYAAMSPYQYRAVGQRSPELYNNFLMETFANMPNSDNTLGNIMTAEDYAKYLRERISPYGYQSGTGLPVPGNNTQGASLAAGYVYSPAQAQAMLRQALSNLYAASQSYGVKNQNWQNMQSTFSNATSMLNDAYTAGLNNLKSLFTAAGLQDKMDAAHGFTADALYKLLKDGTVAISYKDSGGITHNVGTANMNYDPTKAGAYRLLAGLLMTPGSTSQAPAAGATMNMDYLQTLGANMGTRALQVLQAADTLGGNTYLMNAYNQAKAMAEAAGYTMNAQDQFNLLNAIYGNQQGYDFQYNPWALSGTENAAQTLLQDAYTGNSSNKLYDMLWSGLGSAYGGIFRNALNDQYRRQVEAMAGTQAGSQGRNFFTQLVDLFNQYAARQPGFTPLTLNTKPAPTLTGPYQPS